MAKSSSLGTATQDGLQTGFRPRFRPGFRPSFHLVMILLMCAFVFTGFGLTYLGPLASGTFPPAPPIVHFHGIVFFSWMVLLVTQSALVNAKNVRLHRSFGTFGIALAACLVLAGMFITIAGASTVTLSGSAAGVFFLSVVAPPSFAILFAMAIRAVRTPVVHRNLMLIATVSILMPGINRVYLQGVGLTHFPFLETYMTMNAMLVAILWHERRKTGSISRITWIGIAVVVVPQLLLVPVSSTQGWADFIYWLGSLAVYR